MKCCIGKRKELRLMSFVFAVLLLFSNLQIAGESANTKSNVKIAGSNSSEKKELLSYKDYITQYSDSTAPINEVSLSADTADTTGKKETSADGAEAVLSEPGNESVWNFHIDKAGLYGIEIVYSIQSEGSKSAEIGLLLDGGYPFSECSNLTLNRVWENKNGVIEEDTAHNQMRPTQVEVKGFFKADLQNTAYDNARFCFFFEEGTHTLTVRQISETMQIAAMRIYNEEAPKPYKQVASGYESTDSVKGFFQKYEAELAPRKSDIVLYPTYDRSSPLTTPYDAVKIKMNTIGKGTWTKSGQWIEWDIDVKEDGYYKIGMRFRQETLRGMKVSRKITIDGEVPFEELAEYKFSYGSSWQSEFLSDGNEEMLFHLEKGTHVLRMETVLGETEYSVAALKQTLVELNTLYRKIVMITGTAPDYLRDYELDKQIPGLLASFRSCAQELTDEIDRIERLNSSQGSNAAFLRRFAEQLISFCKKPDTVPDRLSDYKSNISTLSTLIIELQTQPLELDCIYLASRDERKPRANANFFSSVVHEARMFAASFVSDYSMIGATKGSEKTLKVWLTLGRDQASIVKSIVEDSFTPRYGIGVELSLIQGSVAEPIMAGKGPDIVIGIARSLISDLAARKVVAPLDDFSGFDEVCERFQKTAMIPYMYSGKTYALPETQEFNMMFVRTDIYEELGLQIPDSWEKLCRQIGVIQQNNLNIGLVNGIHSSVTSALNTGLPSILNALLLQNGMTYYNRSLTGTVFSETKAIEVYQTFTSFFTDLSCTVYFDAVNQFRTGEMPLIVAPLSVYNNLYISAPEIKGSWIMTQIPGSATADGGTLNNSEDASGTGTMMFKSCKSPEAGWEFLKFWTSAETQARFAREIEILMGTGARYMTANTEAFFDLSWSSEERNAIGKQRENVIEFPQLPGNYIITRNLTNAFVSVLDGDNPRDTLLEYALVMDAELERKYQEFKYDTGENYYAKK